MRSRDWFLVSARVLGLWTLYLAANDLMWCGAILLRLGPHDLLDKDYTGSADKAFTTYIWYAVVRLALTAFFLFGSEWLTRWVFGESHREPNGEDKFDAQ
jgi:hypothetical protein